MYETQERGIQREVAKFFNALRDVWISDTGSRVFHIEIERKVELILYKCFITYSNTLDLLNVHELLTSLRFIYTDLGKIITNSLHVYNN